MPEKRSSSTSPDPVIVHIDGAARGNPGPASIGVVVEHGRKILNEISEAIGRTTNNVAEYTALIRALEVLADHGHTSARIYSDSELLVRQMSGQYRVKMPHLIPLYRRAQELWEKFESLTLDHVPREKNKKADALANRALDS